MINGVEKLFKEQRLTASAAFHLGVSLGAILGGIGALVYALLLQFLIAYVG